jgi:predicted nucleic acid-binding protein
VNLYLESSAALAWLLGEPDRAAVAGALSSATLVLASVLTVVECDRVLLRAEHTGRIPATAAAERRAFLATAADHWNLLHLEPSLLARARRRFPVEPIRTPDALHLASALLAQAALPDLALLSLDERVRSNARALGFDLLPPSASG